MAVVQTLEGLENVTLGWQPVSSYGRISLYDSHYTDYATLYRTQPNVRTCVDFLARNIAQLGLHVYRRVSDTDRVREREHPLARLLEQPLPPAMKLTRYRLIERMVGDLGVYHNSFLLKVPRPGGMSLLPVPPMIVTVKGALFPESYEISLGGKVLRPQPEEIVHTWGYSPDNLHQGVSPLETLRRVLAEEWAMGDYREHFWANSARMQGIIERPVDAPEWSQTARERFMAEFAALYSGTEQSGKTAILEEGMQWKEASFSAQESEYLAGRKLTREECARAYHIPLPMVGILDHATFCLPAHVPVFTEEGPRPIVGLKAGDKVWSHDGSGFILKPVVRLAQSGIDPILRIKTQNRTLEANARHPLLVRRLVRVKGEADPNADVKRRAGQSRWCYKARHEFVPAGQIKKGDILVALKELPEIGEDNGQSIGRMEFFGLLIGDGNVYPDRGSIAIARGDDALYMDHYRDVMVSEFRSFAGGNGKAREGVPTKPVTLIEGDRQTRFASVQVAEELAELGFHGTARTKRIPGWIFKAGRGQRLAFLRGYLDADGSVDKRGKISYSSCNPDLIEDIRHLCMSLGIPVSNAYNSRAVGTLPNGDPYQADQYTVTLSDVAANREIWSHDPRYQQRLLDGREWGRKAKAYPFAHGRRSDPPVGCEYSRVVSVEELPAEPVYDLEVADTHNFVAAGIVVHNSNIREQHKSLYTDCLGPWLKMIEQSLMLQLLPDFEDTDGLYIEFNIEEKLRGSFEEQIISLQSAVGRPWMTANEARARMNLPSIQGGDSLVTPLNVLVGAQASPRDTAPPATPKSLGMPQRKADRGELDPTLPELRAQHERKWQEVLERFFDRQEKAIISRVPKASAPAIEQVWNDGSRWDRELAQDLYQLGVATATEWAVYMADELGIELVPETMYDWLSRHARVTANNVNAVTRNAVGTALSEPDFALAVRGVFDIARSAWAPLYARTEVTTASSFGTMEAAKKSPYTTKVWQTNSSNPRATHAALNGVAVAINERFPNGLLWPGDPTGGDADERAGCQCSIGFRRD